MIIISQRIENSIISLMLSVPCWVNYSFWRGDPFTLGFHLLKCVDGTVERPTPKENPKLWKRESNCFWLSIQWNWEFLLNYYLSIFPPQMSIIESISQCLCIDRIWKTLQWNYVQIVCFFLLSKFYSMALMSGHIDYANILQITQNVTINQFGDRQPSFFLSCIVHIGRMFIFGSSGHNNKMKKSFTAIIRL